MRIIGGNLLILKIITSINLLVLQILTVQICKARRILYIMKATGIVRRIDDLGRVVIPKEIRRTMRIREGDPLEIFTGNSGEVVFKKYSPMGEMNSFAGDLVAALSIACDLIIAICDRDRCIAVSGGSKKIFIEKDITDDIEKICESRQKFINSQNSNIYAFEDITNKLLVAIPVISAGDIIGCVVLLESEKQKNIEEKDIKLAEIAAQFLSTRN